MSVRTATAIARLKNRAGGPAVRTAGSGPTVGASRRRATVGGNSGSSGSSRQGGVSKDDSQLPTTSSTGAGRGTGGAGERGGTVISSGSVKPSIKDFKVVEELGTGNFSTIVKVLRSVTVTVTDTVSVSVTV